MSFKAVIVANQAHARFWIWEDADPFDGQRQQLQELESLMNPMEPGVAKEVWSNAKAGRNRGASHQGHGYDDHRQNHLDEFERRFCSAIAAHGKQVIDQHQIRSLVLVAPPEVLGHLRREIQTIWPKHLRIQELSKDLVKQSATELQHYLTQKKLLPSFAEPKH
ncbi:host attachment protein [Lyngbya confervoides]|uniref:Host attachment protein n=1 Tax=Lyngbya confervoides BDU141951 TaxID=1574623 RepID=A0ABD4T7R0_9CYAN|nr:host attachment protein [Lyngbya confervoides]MCM1984484.1 host attachment protein [Lyngbya confervoides BDU141951]